MQKKVKRKDLLDLTTRLIAYSYQVQMLHNILMLDEKADWEARSNWFKNFHTTHLQPEETG